MLLGNDPIEITICLGSSCFARGNSENLTLLKKFEQEHKDKINLHLTGSLCQERCKQGPNLTIDGEFYSGMSSTQLCELLQKLTKSARDHGTA
jgi:NADH:ubiquinone oxidoreductase subunit E